MLLSAEVGWRSPITSGGLKYEAMMASVLADSGQAVVLAPPGWCEGLPESCVRPMRIPFGRQPMAASILIVPRLVWAALLIRPRVIRISSVAYFGLGAIVAASVLRRMGRDICLVGQVLHIEPDGSIDSARGPAGRRLDLAVLRRCRQVTVPSIATAHAVRQVLGNHDAEIAVIPPGIAPDPDPVPGRACSGGRALRLLFVGRLKPRKNPLAFAQACMLLARRRPIEAVVVGKGPLAARARAACDGADVTFTDFVPEVTRLYRWADVVVCTSKLEGFYFVGLEAMSCGAALVSFDSPALRELTGQGTSGRLVPADDVTRLAEALDMDDDELGRLSAAGRRRAASYSMARFRSAVHEALLAPRRVRPDEE